MDISPRHRKTEMSRRGGVGRERGRGEVRGRRSLLSDTVVVSKRWCFGATAATQWRQRAEPASEASHLGQQRPPGGEGETGSVPFVLQRNSELSEG